MGAEEACRRYPEKEKHRAKPKGSSLWPWRPLGGPERCLQGGLTVELVFRYRSWKGVGFHPGKPQNLGCAPRRYLGAPVKNSLSFRKESIQRSSSVSEKLNQVMEAQGQAREQRPISIGTLFTLTQ